MQTIALRSRPAASGVGTWNWDLKAGIFYADQGMAHIFGLDPALAAAGLPPQAYIDRIFPENWPGVELALAPALDAARNTLFLVRM